MPMPESVTKINKDGVKFVSNIDKMQYTIAELSRAALRDTAKLLRRRIKASVPVDTGTLKKNVGSWVRKGGTELQWVPHGKAVIRKTVEIPPYLQVGVYDKERADRKGYPYAYYALWQELGTSTMAACNNGRGFLRATVMDSIDDIRRIQGQYLTAIENENRARGLINEEEEVTDDD